MSWKSDLRVSDLAPGQEIEITCRRCALTRYEVAGDLMQDPDAASLHLDELEARLRCRRRACGGAVRIALDHGRTEGFVGGLA